MQFMRQHSLAIRSAFSNIARAPLSFVFSMLVVAVVLMLPLVGLTMLDNLRPLSQQIAITPEISIFLHNDLTRNQAIALEKGIRKQFSDQHIELKFVPKEVALENLKKESGLSDVISTMSVNPLPDAYVVKFHDFDNQREAMRIVSITDSLRTLHGVRVVQVDSSWIQRLATLINILHGAFFILTIALALMVIGVIFNTIRLQILTHVEEVKVIRLFGASDALIHRPFYYSGILMGLGASVVALGVIAISLMPLNISVEKFAKLYSSSFQLHPFDLYTSLTIIALCSALGLIGAMLSTKWHLSRLP